MPTSSLASAGFDWSGVVLAPLAVGFSLWLVAELVRTWIARRDRTASRRRKIISLMQRAEAVQLRALADGRFERAYVERSSEPLAEARSRYDDLTAEALDLFEPGEEAVAMWTAVEFYGAWVAPHLDLIERNVPREARKLGQPMIDLNSMSAGWELSRPRELVSWANVRWPWDRGNTRGPRYGTLHTIGDETRHRAVRPNSDETTDMLRPYILIDGRAFDEPSKREMKRLRAKYPDWAPR